MNHTFGTCTFPNYWTKCNKCLVTSFDGSGHTNKCKEKGQASKITKNIYSSVSMPVFKLRAENSEDIIYVLNKSSGVFEEASNSRMLASVVNGSFFFGTTPANKSTVEFDATKISRFSIAMAFFSDGAWRLRYRLVVTLTDGILCFPLYITFEKHDDVYRIPPDFNINTALVVGIRTLEAESIVFLKIYANDSGHIVDGNEFNGYSGIVRFDQFLDKTFIGSSLQPSKHGNSKRFNIGLYKTERDTENVSLEPLPTTCQNCEILKSNEPISGSYRSDAYAIAGVNFLEIGTDKNDTIHILNQSTGTFTKIDDVPFVHAHAVNGAFEISEGTIKFLASSIKCFRIAIAYLARGTFSVKYVIDTQKDRAPSVHMLQQSLDNENGIYRIPKDMKTVLIVGIENACSKSMVTIKSNVNANANDNDDDCKEVVYDWLHDRLTVN